MRDHVLDRLASLANALIESNCETEKAGYARHAWRLAQQLYPMVQPSEGSE